jgi:hypothetical protein
MHLRTLLQVSQGKGQSLAAIGTAAPGLRNLLRSAHAPIYARALLGLAWLAGDVAAAGGVAAAAALVPQVSMSTLQQLEHKKKHLSQQLKDVERQVGSGRRAGCLGGDVGTRGKSSSSRRTAVERCVVAVLRWGLQQLQP